MIARSNEMEFNREEYGPYPIKVSGNRICDETVPVKELVPSDPVFNFPDKIGAAAWANWARTGPGEKLGSLVEAKVGKGRWIYLGLGLWRQLPAGTDGAYQLLANLLSLLKAPAGGPAKKATAMR